MSAREWLRDLAFGARLAFTGRRPWSRLAVTAFGIGLGVALLLGAASVPVASQARHDREVIRQAQQEPSEHAAVLTKPSSTEFREQDIRGALLQNQRPNPPTAPGLARNPAPGELVVSPALRDILNGPGGDLLRPRLPGPIVGIIGPGGLTAPNELYFYQGTDTLAPEIGTGVRAVNDHFGESPQRSGSAFPENAWYVLALGVVALLVPIVVYVAATVRLAEAARQRRLAAMRLVGASGTQIRRISTGEALVGTVLGVVFGWALYFAGRAVAANVSVMGFVLFPSDIWPLWWLALLVTLGIPVLAVFVTLAAMRQSIVEPLGVTRQSVSRPRRLIWRLLPLVVGVAGLLLLTTWTPRERMPVFVGSTAMILIAIPLLLPWCVERAVRRLRGGGPAWQLAVRRLQLSSGTAARSVSAIAVVVSGVIAVQMALAGAAADAGDPGSAPGPDHRHIVVSGNPATPSAVAETERRLRGIDGVSGDIEVSTSVYVAGGNGSYGTTAVIADCATINRWTAVPDCRDGDAFLRDPAGLSPEEKGESLQAGQWVEFYNARIGVGDGPETTRWQVPAGARQIAALQFDLVVTPAAATGIPSAVRDVSIKLWPGPAASPDAIEHVRNVAETGLISGSANYAYGGSQVNDEALAIAAVRAVLLAGAALTFALIGCSLFVLAAEQIQERRRPLAVLGAVGVSRRTLWLSVLLQNGVPMLVATVLAGVVGVVLGLLALSGMDSNSVGFDLPGMLGLFGLAAIAVVVVTALTLPALGRATDPEGLRTE